MRNPGESPIAHVPADVLKPGLAGYRQRQTLLHVANRIRSRYQSKRDSACFAPLTRIGLRRHGAADRTGHRGNQLRHEGLHINWRLGACRKLVCRDPRIKLAGLPTDGTRAKRNGRREYAACYVLPDRCICTANLCTYLRQTKNAVLRNSACAHHQVLNFILEGMRCPLEDARMGTAFHCDLLLSMEPQRYFARKWPYSHALP